MNEKRRKDETINEETDKFDDSQYLTTDKMRRKRISDWLTRYDEGGSSEVRNSQNIKVYRHKK